MKAYKILAALLLIAALAVALCSCSVSAPTIGANGNWFIDGVDTGVSAGGNEKGDDGDSSKLLEVTSYETVSNVNGIHVYKLIFSDGTEVELTAKSGVATDIISCVPVEEKSTETSHVYKITFSSGVTGEFTVTDSTKDGVSGTATLEDVKNYEMTLTQTAGMSVITVNAATLENGAYLRPEKLVGDELVPVTNTLMNNKSITATLDIDNLNSASVIIGQGETEKGASYIEITKTHVKFYTMGDTLNNYASHEHDLNISEFLNIAIEIKYGTATVTLRTADAATSAVGIPEEAWQGRDGAPFIKVVGSDAENVKLSWHSNDISNRIYIVGDSYISPADTTSWAYYLIDRGYVNHCMLGSADMTATRALEEFKYALELGTPQYAFWCVGMNDADNGAINADWQSATEEFLELCESKGITPVLATMPSTATSDNTYKNAYIKSWARDTEGMYVDFNKAVVQNSSTGAWYASMLGQDGFHPSESGAKALYMQAVTDFPQLIQK